MTGYQCYCKWLDIRDKKLPYREFAKEIDALGREWLRDNEDLPWWWTDGMTADDSRADLSPIWSRAMPYSQYCRSGFRPEYKIYYSGNSVKKVLIDGGGIYG